MKLTEAQTERIHKLADDQLGMLLPDDLVEDAVDENSPLHDLFEWDDQKAAAKHRLEQARNIIRHVLIPITVNQITLRAPHYVRDPYATGQGYRSVFALQKDRDHARDALMGELMRAAGMLKRAVDVAAALGLTSEIDDLLAKIAGVQRLLESQAA